MSAVFTTKTNTSDFQLKHQIKHTKSSYLPMGALLKWNKGIKMWAKNASTLLIEDRGVNEAVMYVLAERTLLRNALTRIGRPVGRGRLRGTGCTKWRWSPRLEIGDWWKNLLNSYAFLRRPAIYSLETWNQSGTWCRELSVKHLKGPSHIFYPYPHST